MGTNAETRKHEKTQYLCGFARNPLKYWVKE
jgi:hypothetical protein